jgi:hypothetical protein
VDGTEESIAGGLPLGEKLARMHESKRAVMILQTQLPITEKLSLQMCLFKEPPVASAEIEVLL